MTISARASGSRRALSLLVVDRVARAAHEADRVVPKLCLRRLSSAHPRLQGVQRLSLRLLGFPQDRPRGHVGSDRLAGFLVAHLGLFALRRCVRVLLRHPPVGRWRGRGRNWQRQLPASKSRSGRTVGVSPMGGVVRAQGSEPLACSLQGVLHPLRGDHLRVPRARAPVSMTARTASRASPKSP